MTIRINHSSMNLENKSLSFSFTRSGDIRSISSADLQISQYLPHNGDPGIAGIWLRHRNGVDIDQVIPLIGSLSAATFNKISGREAIWRGTWKGNSWNVDLLLQSPKEWVWTIRVHTRAMGEWDLVTAQDVALAPKAQALTSEPYISQYITYRTIDDRRHGVVLGARQTMASAPILPLLITAMTPSAHAVMTDGFDFYGSEVRGGEQARALKDINWRCGGIRQYEFGMMCLLSDPQITTQENNNLAWQQSFSLQDNNRGDMTQSCRVFANQLSVDVPNVQKISDSNGGKKYFSPLQEPSIVPISLINGQLLSNDEFLALSHGTARDVERDTNGTILSYFMKDAAHFVSARKETMVDRSHGQILLAGFMDSNSEPRVGQPVLSTTAWMPGIFGSHTVLGNSNLHTLISIHRDALNLLRMNGVRIILHDENEPYMLGIPSAFKMELGKVTWIYKLNNGVIRIILAADVHEPVLVLRIESSIVRDVTIMMNITGSWHSRTDCNRIYLSPASEPVSSICPQLVYRISAAHLLPHWNQEQKIIFFRGKISDETVFLSASEHGLHKADESVQQTAQIIRANDLDNLEKRYVSSFASFDRSFHVSSSVSGKKKGVKGVVDDADVIDSDLEEFNLLVPWFTQNALVHLLSPHGLEQYSGAAWGTRDVLQGPLELCLAFHHLRPVREILLRIFAKQAEDGSLPQWFMFDQYTTIFQASSHDDIPIWPLLATAEYLKDSGDTGFLGLHVPFRTVSSVTLLPNDTTTVMDHLFASLRYISNHRVPGTRIYSYGEGDWDDTLQPVHEGMKETMASTWTVALLYQASVSLGNILAHTNYAAEAHQFLHLAADIKKNYTKNFLFDGVLAGYVIYEFGRPKPLIHPEDNLTGMRYRLIPMTRAIISGVIDANIATDQENIIEKYLHYPDGVRLMDHPAQFHDGIPRIFKRAEQSSFVGREIGLMYTHAHIRYVEALAALGKSAVADELLRVSPINQYYWLSTSQLRQRNCYFASSDADFRTRYDADKQWDRLKKDAKNPVEVKGGWRVYSSGPGIYISQIVRHVFGLNIRPDSIVFDPLMRQTYDGTILTFNLWGKNRQIIYHVSAGSSLPRVAVDGRLVTGTLENLTYRTGGLSVKRQQIGHASRIEVWFGSSRGNSALACDANRANIVK